MESKMNSFMESSALQPAKNVKLRGNCEAAESCGTRSNLDSAFWILHFAMFVSAWGAYQFFAGAQRESVAGTFQSRHSDSERATGLESPGYRRLSPPRSLLSVQES